MLRIEIVDGQLLLLLLFTGGRTSQDNDSTRGQVLMPKRFGMVSRVCYHFDRNDAHARAGQAASVGFWRVLP